MKYRTEIPNTINTSSKIKNEDKEGESRGWTS